jgi:hypothetical protein
LPRVCILRVGGIPQNFLPNADGNL